MTIFSRTPDETDAEFVEQVLEDLVNLTDASLGALKAKHKVYVKPAGAGLIDVAEILSDQVVELAGATSVLLGDISQLEHSLASLSRRNDELADDLDAVHDWSYDAALDASADEFLQMACDSGHGNMNPSGDTLNMSCSKSAVKSMLRNAISKWVIEKLK
jgi:hypothetical protein